MSDSQTWRLWGSRIAALNYLLGASNFLRFAHWANFAIVCGYIVNVFDKCRLIKNLPPT